MGDTQEKTIFSSKKIDLSIYTHHLSLIVHTYQLREIRHSGIYFFISSMTDNQILDKKIDISADIFSDFLTKNSYPLAIIYKYKKREPYQCLFSD